MRARNREAGHSELDVLFNPWFWAVMAVIIAATSLSYLFVTDVGTGEIVIKDCGGDLTVWRHPRDAGTHWDGFCRTETYDQVIVIPFKEPVSVDGAWITLRGRFLITLPTDDGTMLGLHRAYVSEAGLRAAMSPLAFQALREAAAEPSWHQPKGGIVARKAKDALEYAMKRVSPIGAVWTSPEAKHALADAAQQRIDFLMAGTGVSASIELGFVTER